MSWIFDPKNNPIDRELEIICSRPGAHINDFTIEQQQRFSQLTLGAYDDLTPAERAMVLRKQEEETIAYEKELYRRLAEGK